MVRPRLIMLIDTLTPLLPSKDAEPIILLGIVFYVIDQITGEGFFRALDIQGSAFGVKALREPSLDPSKQNIQPINPANCFKPLHRSVLLWTLRENGASGFAVREEFQMTRTKNAEAVGMREAFCSLRRVG